ncbi:pilus assembly protein PilY [Azotobacter chroococcum subsp. isscasi]|uniref:pilus assembly protein n=1 Tax=Azotobacter chroococcum TaxID=353 RepID=UPI00103D646F|nr:pilus assembly protein PilY [Azotobacter chroococcum]TBW06584.1 pilus assembly protein PilY [Azotobacter chroococcum subsp. isscasi]
MLAATLLAISAGAHAEDIDLFVGVEPEHNTDYPNVVILLDNTANWADNAQHFKDSEDDIFQGQAELAAIRTVISSLAPAGEDAKINVGLMMLNKGTGSSSFDGGYVRSHVKQMTKEFRAEFLAEISKIEESFSTGEQVSTDVGYSRAMFEVFKYFGGYTSPALAYSDTAGSPVDSTHFGPMRYSGNAAVDCSKKSNADDISCIRDPDAFSDGAQTIYNPAAPTTETCKSKNYVIVIGNGWSPNDEDEVATLLQNVGGDASQIYSTTSAKVRYGDEVARLLYQTDVSSAPGKQNVLTYAIDVYNAQPSEDHTKLLKSMARVGGGKYFSATDADEIETALANILSEIQAVNSVFASVSLPVSVNTQGTYLNQVYVGMFRPDANALPRWAGNLKQYKLGLVDNELKTLDAQNQTAINSSTGFITECARSFWTPSSVTLPTYWSNVVEAPAGGCLAVDDSTYADYPDGNVVEKGAQSYKLRTLSGIDLRNIKSCATTACGAMVDFSSAQVTAISADEVNWGRGGNVPPVNDAGEPLSEFVDTSGTSATTVRPSVHADVVHSRPVAINFGTDSDTDVVVFYGGNDGILRAVNGNRDTGGSIDGIVPGGELWSFMAPEFHAQIARLRENNISINYRDREVAESVTTEPKPYGVDGPITAYRDAGEAWIYAAMRRGGRALYAFEVSDSDLGTPVFKWRIGCSPDIAAVDCTSDFDRLGQTWSSAKPFQAAGYESGNAPLLIMGAGYDTCEDTDDGTHNHSCGDTPLGNRIYVLDADDGHLVSDFDGFQTERSVVGDVTIVPDENGRAIYAYAADTGGNVYRITFGTAVPDDWSITRIASLGCDALASCNANRKFMFAPDVVMLGDTYYVLLGSGDREKPLASYEAATSVSNYFFMLKDKPGDSTWLTSESGNCGGSNLLCMSSLFGITGTGTPSDAVLAEKKGWYLAFADNEQVVTSAITVYGTVTFSTHTPAVYSAGQCSSLGTAKVYNIDYSNAESENGTTMRYEVIAGGGLPPSPVAGMVTLDDRTTVPFVIGSDPDSPLEGGSPKGGSDVVQPKAKVYWNIER